jgi:hypothetical protein
MDAQAKTLHVANNGVDSPTCGDKGDPCRTINQVIANATEGDGIEVGPGHYGDLNGDGVFGGPGEETPPDGCICMIRVDKAVTIESRDGAGATVLDAGGADAIVVDIEASGAVFGKKNRGFTLTKGSIGLLIAGGTSGVTVRDNLAVANTEGFSLPAGSSSGHELRDNIATANSICGFSLAGSDYVVKDNLAGANGGDGFDIHGSGQKLNGNVANANGGEGFALSGSGHELIHNAAVGNKLSGVTLFASGTVIRRNNIYGNAVLDNCGLVNTSGDLIDATNNFWGAASGPGPDPADRVCNRIGSITLFTPFATKEFKVKAGL